MGRYRRIIDKLLALQKLFYLSDRTAEQWMKEGEGNVALLQIVGVSGESLLLKYEHGRLDYARGDESPKHVFVTSEDTFLDLVVDPTAENLRSKITKGHFAIRDASTGEINLVEVQKWVRGFQMLGRVVKHVLMGAKVKG